MELAVALLSYRSLGFALYAATLNGMSVDELAAEHKISVHEIRERIDATFLTLTRQVQLGVNPDAGVFRDQSVPAFAA